MSYVTGSTLYWSGSIYVPDVTDPVTAESVRHGFRSLADRTSYLSASVDNINSLQQWMMCTVSGSSVNSSTNMSLVSGSAKSANCPFSIVSDQIFVSENGTYKIDFYGFVASSDTANPKVLSLAVGLYDSSTTIESSIIYGTRFSATDSDKVAMVGSYIFNVTDYTDQRFKVRNLDGSYFITMTGTNYNKLVLTRIV